MEKERHYTVQPSEFAAYIDADVDGHTRWLTHDEHVEAHRVYNEGLAAEGQTNIFPIEDCATFRPIALTDAEQQAHDSKWTQPMQTFANALKSEKGGSD